MELATRFNGEIINCDAMQMYKGLPIITNKIPLNEQDGIPHHLLGFIDVKEKPWSVQHFVKQSSRIIDEIRARGKLPILVGGTIYYTFSLLFEHAILSPTDVEDTNASVQESVGKSDQDFPVLSASTEEIFAKLKEVDPDMAKRWHPNDRSKIRRSLEIYLKTGRKASEIYADQRGATSGETDPALEGIIPQHRMPLRYPSLLLWLEAEDDVLKQRLNDRVDQMIESGLCGEVLQMASLEQDLSQDEHVDLTNGIWASIGYKEMKPWVEAQRNLSDNDAERSTLKNDGIEAVKASTRRYAKRQNRFVRIRLADALKAAGRLDMLFLLDCTDLTRWDPSVTRLAETITTAFLTGHELPSAGSLSQLAKHMFSQIHNNGNGTVRGAKTCEVCNKTLMTEKEWTGHLASRGHKKVVAWQRRHGMVPVAEVEHGQSLQLPTPPG